MACFLKVNDDDNIRKINIDDLYDSQQKRDLKQVSIFNKILNRIYNRITVTGRTKKNDRHTWFTIPEYIFGEPVYDKGDCIAYIVSKLEENGFQTNYVHPNTLFVSWGNWIPSYVRTEIKKKKGIIIDSKGNVLEKKEDGEQEENPNSGYINDKNGNSNKKQFTPIGNYKPTGNLVYNQEMFDKLEKKVVFNV
jgi:transcription initiation factor IIE alpha subunit